MEEYMEESKSLDIIKHAILLERRGRAFYRKVSEQTDEAVKEFFEMMAGEENKHISVLSEQYNFLRKEGHFSSAFSDISETGATISEALSNEIKEKISAASYESAAISAAIGFEESAVKLYSSRTGNVSIQRCLWKLIRRWLKPSGMITSSGRFNWKWFQNLESG